MAVQTLQELLEERANVVTEARSTLDLASKENRNLSDAESETVSKLQERAATLTDEIKQVEQRQKIAERQDEFERLLDATPNQPVHRSQPGNDGDRLVEGPFKWQWRDNLFRGESRELEFHKDDADPLRAGVWQRAQKDYEIAFRRMLSSTNYDRRDLNAHANTEGGYLVPTAFISRLIKFVDDAVHIRRLATVLPMLNGSSAGVPSLDADPDDADWTTELQTGSEDSTMAFGKRELHPHPLAKRIKVSKRLLRLSALNVEDLVLQRLGYKFGVTEEKAFRTGSGNQQPLGVYTASNDGISTSRDVSTGNTTTSIGFDGLYEAKYSLKSQYWQRARWDFHRDAVKQIAKLKDGEGQYLWQPSVQAGQPDRLLGLPMDVSEFSPNTFTTGQYVGLLADWSYYWIADNLMMTIQSLMELYAETNQVGYIGRKETDGMPVLEEAFARVKLA